MNQGTMETLHQAISRLESRGYTHAFRAMAGGDLEVKGHERFSPESLVLEETVRFEGVSDPADEAVLFALRSRDGRTRGTFVASYGTNMEPSCVATIERLTHTSSKNRRTHV